jgi:hypothetical protein
MSVLLLMASEIAGWVLIYLQGFHVVSLPDWLLRMAILLMGVLLLPIYYLAKAALPRAPGRT